MYYYDYREIIINDTIKTLLLNVQCLLYSTKGTVLHVTSDCGRLSTLVTATSHRCYLHARPANHVKYLKRHNYTIRIITKISQYLEINLILEFPGCTRCFFFSSILFFHFSIPGFSPNFLYLDFVNPIIKDVLSWAFNALSNTSGVQFRAY